MVLCKDDTKIFLTENKAQQANDASMKHMKHMKHMYEAHVWSTLSTFTVGAMLIV